MNQVLQSSEPQWCDVNSDTQEIALTGAEAASEKI